MPSWSPSKSVGTLPNAGMPVSGACAADGPGAPGDPPAKDRSGTATGWTGARSSTSGGGGCRRRGRPAVECAPAAAPGQAAARDLGAPGAGTASTKRRNSSGSRSPLVSSNDRWEPAGRPRARPVRVRRGAAGSAGAGSRPVPRGRPVPRALPVHVRTAAGPAALGRAAAARGPGRRHLPAKGAGAHHPDRHRQHHSVPASATRTSTASGTSNLGPGQRSADADGDSTPSEVSTVTSSIPRTSTRVPDSSATAMANAPAADQSSAVKDRGRR